MEKTPRGMGTLDRLWGTIPEETKDSKMMDMEDKTEEKLMNPSESKEKTTKQQTTVTTSTTTTTSTTGVTTMDTTPLFPMAVRFMFKANSIADASNKHIEILSTIAKNMKHCEVYSKSTEKVNLQKMDSSNFDYHKRGQMYIVVHRLILDVKYHEIKKTVEIFTCIKRNDCFIQEHVWTTKEWDILTIGFLSGISPKHQSKDLVKHKLELIEKSPLQYNLHATTLTGTRNATKYSTRVYEIQCRRQDAEDISKYIAHTSREYGQTFVKRKWKYTNPDVYVNALLKQIDFVNNIRTIPIYGVTSYAMQTLYNKMIAKKEILEIGSTSKTAELGRWNVYTKLTNFPSTRGEVFVVVLQNGYNLIYTRCMTSSTRT